MGLRAKIYITLVILVGWANLAHVIPHWHPVGLAGFAIYLLTTLFAGGLKLRLPGVTGTISVGFCFVLIGIVSLSLPEVLLTGCLAVLVQCFWHSAAKPRPVQLLFNVANSSIAITGSYQLFHSVWLRSFSLELPVLLAILAASYFVSTTILVAAAIALTEGKSLRTVWRTSYLWAFPYYVLGTATAGLFEIAQRHLGWQSSMLVIPGTYLVYRSCRMYLGRLDDDAKHARETAALHLRTIESLALAIEAKDHTTHEHLQRVQVYAMEIGKELKLSPTELQALQAASILHDIGKIAVPEHILCKPGKLTPEEFQRIKVHPVVGAEILARAQFPYPVVPIVRSHHEKWDGSGYPDGLHGEDIPIGARILSVVDCLDALASDRQYRRALPLDKAMEIVTEQSHKAFDPRIVEILQKRYIELEQLARSSPAATFTLSTDIEIGRGAAPDAGFEQSKESRVPPREGGGDSLVGLLQTLERKAGDLPQAEIYSILAGCIRQVIPCDGLVIYSSGTAMLTAEYACGLLSDRLMGLRVPLGQGLSGWVAANRKPIVNGNPGVDCAALDNHAGGPGLRSALAMPVESERGVVGVLTLMREQADAFSQNELRTLSTAGFAVGQLLEIALQYRPQPALASPAPRDQPKVFSQ